MRPSSAPDSEERCIKQDRLASRLHHLESFPLWPLLIWLEQLRSVFCHCGLVLPSYHASGVIHTLRLQWSAHDHQTRRFCCDKDASGTHLELTQMILCRLAVTISCGSFSSCSGSIPLAEVWTYFFCAAAVSIVSTAGHKSVKVLTPRHLLWHVSFNYHKWFKRRFVNPGEEWTYSQSLQSFRGYPS